MYATVNAHYLEFITTLNYSNDLNKQILSLSCDLTDLLAAIDDSEKVWCEVLMGPAVQLLYHPKGPVRASSQSFTALKGRVTRTKAVIEVLDTLAKV